MLQVCAALLAAEPFPRVQVTPEPHNEIAFTYDGREILRYNYGPDAPLPYFFPLIGPAGQPVTRITHPHDPDTHRHHLSLWISHQKVDDVNFWSFAKDSGKIVFEKIVKIDDGESGLLTIQSKWQDAQGKTLLRDLRTWRFIPRPDAPGEFFLDLDLTLTPEAPTLTLGKTNFGLVAVRVAKTMGVIDGGGVLTDSEGRTGEKEIFEQCARWCDYSGPAAPGKNGGAPIVNGITLMDHADNPRHPTYWHVRGDGWMGAAFTHAEALEIKKESPLKLRYRFWIHDGVYDKEKCAAIWTAWTAK